jgi:molybdenum cofactor biosynthesis protein B
MMLAIKYTPFMHQSSTAHQQMADQRARRQPVQCAILTISDTRTPDTDLGGPLIEKYLLEARHIVLNRMIVRDDPVAIASQIEQWIGDASIHAILITGGTGISRRDNTVEIVRRFITIELEGFGELFRLISYQHVKAAAMMSRAVAGLIIRDHAQGGETFIFAMPGSTNAVETAMANLIAPQLAHLVWERTK